MPCTCPDAKMTEALGLSLGAIDRIHSSKKLSIILARISGCSSGM